MMTITREMIDALTQDEAADVMGTISAQHRIPATVWAVADVESVTEEWEDDLTPEQQDAVTAEVWENGGLYSTLSDATEEDWEMIRSEITAAIERLGIEVD